MIDLPSGCTILRIEHLANTGKDEEVTVAPPFRQVLRGADEMNQAGGERQTRRNQPELSIALNLMTR